MPRNSRWRRFKLWLDKQWDKVIEYIKDNENWRTGR